jgi:BlaI family transcriptional regulator, penicillinase repressor
MVGDLLRSVFGGDPKALLAHLVSEREVSTRDLERVRELLARKSEKPR